MNELRIIENELVPVYETSTGEKVVYGTELYGTLEVKSKFADWIKNRFADCDAIENKDFEAFSKILENGGRAIEYIIKLDTAKEMAMLERNEKGKQVRRYFIQIEKKYMQLKESQNQVPFKEVVEAIPCIAADLRVNAISRLSMYKNLCTDFGVPSGFLPDYVQGGDREKKPVTELLKEVDSPYGAVKFNKLLLEAGILEERSRKSSSSKKGVKTYKSLTQAGIEYGENQINTKNEKETQPYYYVDAFHKLYDLIMAFEVA